MSRLLRKSLFIGFAFVWIVFPTVIFGNNVINHKEELIYSENKWEASKGDIKHTFTQEQWDKHKYSGKIVIQYFEYVIFIPSKFIFYMPNEFSHRPLESIVVLVVFLAVSGLYYLFNFQKYNEFD